MDIIQMMTAVNEDGWMRMHVIELFMHYQKLNEFPFNIQFN